MASSGRKLVIHESEKSQKVQMFNWVEDARHARGLRSLSRSEKTVVGKITVDQKLLYRRYNNRLHHSRITFARVTENRELEKELLNKVHFNTDVGLEGEHDSMLQRIWSSGSQKMEQLRRMRHSRKSRQYESQFKLRIRSLKEDDDERDEALEEACISRPTTARSLRSMHMAVHRPRPHTAMDRVRFGCTSQQDGGSLGKKVQLSEKVEAAEEVNKEVGNSEPKSTEIKVVIKNEFGECLQPDTEGVQTVVNSLSNCDISSKDTRTLQNPSEVSHIFKVTEMNNNNVELTDKNVRQTDKQATEPQSFTLSVHPTDDQAVKSSAEEALSNDQQNNNKDDKKLDTPESRPKTTTGQLSPFFSPSSRTGSRSHSRQMSVSTRPNQHNHVKIGSLFPEDTKPSLLELQKVQVKLADYKGKIKKFGDSLGDMRLPSKSDHSVDYYNIRLRSSTEAELERKRQNLRQTYKDLVTTTEGEYRRWKGNIDVRSMTTRTVDLDFDNRHSSYIDVSMY